MGWNLGPTKEIDREQRGRVQFLGIFDYPTPLAVAAAFVTESSAIYTQTSAGYAGIYQTGLSGPTTGLVIKHPAVILSRADIGVPAIEDLALIPLGQFTTVRLDGALQWYWGVYCIINSWMPDGVLQTWVLT